MQYSVAQRLGYIGEETSHNLRAAADETGSALHGLMNHWQERTDEAI